MLKGLISLGLNKFEKKYRYDVSYMREILEASTPLILQFSKFTKLSRYRKMAPKDLRAVAGIAALKVADCGPCLQLGVDFALEDGVDRAVLENAVRHTERLNVDQKLAYDFATAVASNADNHAELAEQFLKRFGHAVRVEVGMCIATAVVYPTLKRALGHAMSCQLVKVRI